MINHSQITYYNNYNIGTHDIKSVEANIRDDKDIRAIALAPLKHLERGSPLHY